MTKKCQTTRSNTSALAVPEQVSVAMAEIAEDMREGLLALAVGTGLQVMSHLMEADVAAACGPRGKHDAERAAVRHGREAGSVTLGGRRVRVDRPRVRAADGSGEVAVPGYELFSSTELLGKMAMERMLGGLSTRRYGLGLEPVGEAVEDTSTAKSRSAVSRKFVALTETALSQLMSGDLSGLDLVAVMVDGVHFADHLCVVALGIDIDGTKHPLALVEGFDREHHPGPLAAGRAARARSGRHQADPGRPRRRQSTHSRGQGGLRPSGDRAVPTAQAPQRS